MFHVELRRFPHSARAFNLSERELVNRVLAPWLRGEEFAFGERRWDPRRCDLQIVEGEPLRPDELSMGRGWQNALRSGKDVTQHLLAVGVGAPEGTAAAGVPSALDAFRVALLEACLDGPLRFSEVVALADERFAGSRASERLAVCEQTVWRLLHAGELQIVSARGPVQRERWEGLVLSWDTWADPAAALWLIRPAPPPA